MVAQKIIIRNWIQAQLFFIMSLAPHNFLLILSWAKDRARLIDCAAPPIGFPCMTHGFLNRE